MDKQIAALKVALANTFMMYFKAHSYHWNVEGIHFGQFHEFFGDIYEDVHGAVDVLAENLRKLEQYAPISLTELYSFKTCSEDITKPATVKIMLNNLLADNREVYNALSKVFDAATEAKNQGLANFAADRMDTHKKYEWMILSFMKAGE